MTLTGRISDTSTENSPVFLQGALSARASVMCQYDVAVVGLLTRSPQVVSFTLRNGVGANVFLILVHFLCRRKNNSPW